MSIYQLIRGTKGYDYYRGDDFAQRIIGRAGDDDLGGGGGDDFINGGDGNDLIEGGTGADTLIGGKGIDAVSFAYASDSPDGGVYVNLAEGFARDFADGSTDSLRGFEVVIGSNYADTIYGSLNNDDLRGGAGNDLLDGGAGSDTLRGGEEGYDILEGGDGFDFADYFYSAGGVISLAVGFATTVDGDQDRLFNIEGVHGSQHADTIIGDANINELWGEIGDDGLFGGEGDDRLIGGTGNDRLVGGLGIDTLWGGTGADRFVFVEQDTWVRNGGAPSTATETIVDFSHDEGDRIVLRAIDANEIAEGDDAFSFVGDAAFGGHAGELRAAVVDGNTVIEADRNGDGQADFTITLLGEHVLVAGDFVL